jgi:hypothetical protein
MLYIIIVLITTLQLPSLAQTEEGNQCPSSETLHVHFLSFAPQRMGDFSLLPLNPTTFYLVPLNMFSSSKHVIFFEAASPIMF